MNIVVEVERILTNSLFQKIKKMTHSIKMSFVGREEVQHTIIEISQYRKAMITATPDWISNIDIDWEPSHQYRQHHHPEPSLDKLLQNPGEIRPSLDTFLQNLDEIEPNSNSAKYNITPVNKIKLIKRKKDTGSPISSVLDMRIESVPTQASLPVDDIASDRNETNRNTNLDIIHRTEHLMTNPDSHSIGDQEDNYSQIETGGKEYSGEYVESVSEFEEESESELESEYGERGWIKEESRMKVENWIKLEFPQGKLKEENIMTWTSMKTEPMSDIDVKSEPISEIELMD